jgi:AcrR family transcriptional regulator
LRDDHQLIPGLMAASKACMARSHTRPARTVGDPRRRLVAAAERIVCEQGAQAVSVSAVCAAARLSRATFEDVFADGTDCLLAVFDDLSEKLAQLLLAAYRQEDCWLDGVRSALLALLCFFERCPNVARFLVLGSLAGGPPMLARRAELLADAALALQRGVPSVALGTPGGAPFGADAIVGTIVSVLHARVQESRPRLRELCPSLMAMIVLFYLGVGAARAELSRKVPAASQHDPADGTPLAYLRGAA